MSVRPRIPELDGLRTLAISAVMLHHFLPGIYTELGWVGVDLFFVLSGFLITGVLLDLRSDPTPYAKFYWRRAIRIFPPYYAVLAIIAVLAFAQHCTGDPKTWLRVLLFVPAINRGISFHLVLGRLAGRIRFDMSHRFWVWTNPGSRYIDGLGPYWSLAVEELFYLLWAPVVLKCSRKTIMAFAILPLVLCPILRGLTHTADFIEIWGFIPRLDTLALGGCLALLLRTKPNLPRWALLAPVPPILVSLSLLCVHCGLLRGLDIRSYETFGIFGYSLLACLFGCVVGTCVLWQSHPALSPLRLRPVVYVGTISYTMYLIHVEVWIVLSNICSASRISSGDVLLGTAAATLTVGVAAVSWRFYESRFLRLRNWPDRVRQGAEKSFTATAGG